MKKLRNLLFVLVGLLVFTLAMVKVNAEIEFSYNADSDTKTDYAKNTAIALIAGDDLASVSTVRSSKVQITGAGQAIYVDDISLTFSKGMVPSGNCATADNAALKIVSKVAGVKIGYYYTISDSTFATGNPTTNPDGHVMIMSATGDVVKTFEDVPGNNNEAYYVEYTINNANETILIGSNKRVITWGLVISQGEVAQQHTVTIKDFETLATLKTLQIIDGEPVQFVPTTYGKDFRKYVHDDGDFSAYNGEGIIEDTTLLVLWEDWQINVEHDYLSPELIGKIAHSFTAFDANQEVISTRFTILKGSGMESSSNSIKTNGGLAPKTSEKGIRMSLNSGVSGTLTVCVKSGGSSERSARLAYLNGDVITEIPATSGEALFAAGADSETAPRTLTYHIDANLSNYFYFGGSNGMKVYSMGFQEDVEQTTAFGVKTGYNLDNVEVARAIMIVNGVSEDEIAAGLAQMKIAIYDGETELMDITNLCTIADRLIEFGQTYMATIDGQAYTFDKQDGRLYVVAVIAVSNYAPTGLGEEFVGKTLTIKVIAGGYVGHQDSFTVQGAAGNPRLQ